MARPFLGNAYGNTDRSTPARLLGGMPESSSQAPIAGGQLAAPALQAVQQLVETFSPAGGAPMMRGPVQLPTPPNLPQAQNPIVSPLPRPTELRGTKTFFNQVGQQTVQPSVVQAPTYAPYVDNMGALAQSLSGFSTFFDKLQKFADTREKVADERAKAEGTAVAEEIRSNYGIFSSYGEALRAVDRKAQEGDEASKQLLIRLRALNPASNKYANISTQDAFQKMRIAAAPEAFKRITTLPSGRNRLDVMPGDPELTQVYADLVMPKGTTVAPEVMQANQAAAFATYGQLNAAQMKDYGEAKANNTRTGTRRSLQGNTAMLAAGKMSIEEWVQGVGTNFDIMYEEGLLTQEERLAEEKALPQTLADIVVATAGGDFALQARLAGLVADGLEFIPTGRPAADGSRPRLIDKLGSADVVKREFFRLAMKGISEDRELDRQQSGWRGEDRADQVIAKMFTPEVLSDPAKFRQAKESVGVMAEQACPEGDLECQVRFTDRANKFITNKEKGYVAPVQERTAVELSHQQAMNPSANMMDLLPEYKRLYDQGYLSEAAYNRLAGNVRSAAREDAQGAMGQAKDNARILERRLKELNMGPGGVLDVSKEAEIQRKVAQFFQQQLNTIRANPGKDMTGTLSQQLTGALEPIIQQRQEEARKPLFITPSGAVQRYRLNQGGRGDRNVNQQLLNDAKYKAIYPAETFRQQMAALGQGKPLDPETRKLLRRLNELGMPASEFFIQQGKIHGDAFKISPAIEQELRKLDGSDLVSQAPVPMGGPSMGMGMIQPGRYSALASRLVDDFTAGALNLFTPPAAAAPMPMGTAGRVSRPFTGDTGSNQVAARMLPPQTRALLRTIRFAEGTAHQDGYRTMFTGAKFNDLSRHPRQINRGGGFASDAAGAYQFLSTTWDSVSGGAMTPVRQDLAAVKLISARGVDPNLPKGFTVQVADKLAPEWASFPTAKTGTSYYGQGGKSYAQLKAYYDRVLREEMARRR